MSEFGFPKQTFSQSQGRAGEASFERFVTTELGWIYRPVHRESDFGIDGYVDVVLGEKVTGRGIAVQIKCGDSYVAKRTSGGIKYEERNQMLNYYMNQSVPVILIVMSGDCNEGYWVEFDLTRTNRSASGWWIEIPIKNRLSQNVTEPWSRIAGPVEDYSDVVQLMWEVDDLVQSTEYQSFAIPYEEVQERSVDYIVELVSRLSKTRDSLLRNRGKVEIYFPGFDSDPRELYEIREVREWFAATIAHGVPWFYFLDTRGRGGSIKLLLFSTCPYSAGPIVGTRQLVEVPGPAQAEWLMKNFANLNAFTQMHEISEEINMERSLAVTALLAEGFEEAKRQSAPS